MVVGVALEPISTRLARLYGATAMACLFTFLAAQLPALSQELPDLGVEVEDGAQMLLEADTLIYDNNDDTVSAAGSVRIDYGGNKMVADRVTYDRNTRRLIATGNVQIVQTDGTKVFSDKIDITDDFADGFVNTLRVETVDKTYFAAESADRRGGFLTTFNNGVYTACEPCEEKPDQPPIWRLKAKKIIWNSKAKTVRFENSGFEFFGVQLARFPAFEIADPTVKRKSGFLFPGITYQSELGVGVTVPYYFALSPTYDLTVVANGFSEQGFLGEAEFRQRFNNGEYSITAAAINQLNPEAFDVATVDRGPIGDPNKFRAMMGTKGQFAINSRWDVGWDILLQTDKNFSNTYSIGGYSQGVHTSQIYLRGLEDRNYFDLAALRFDVQEDALNSNPSARSDKQPWVLPTWDYSYTADEPVYGGELNFDMNLRVLSRDNEDISPTTWNSDPTLAPFVQRIRGIEGESARLTAEGEWKRSFVSDGGLVLTSLLAFQADTTHVNASQSSIDAINSMANNPVIDAGTDIRSAYNRFMATAGLEMRFPVLFSSTSASHILEPTAQVFARPDEGYGGTLGIPNEDAQSFVFDATTLFERDKFSGYDRVEGGTRANLGLRYAATYDNGWALNGLAGQSYHLAGRNSFDSPDFVNVGAYSGLETETSDYVGLFGFSAPNGLSASVSARLDERTLEMRRGEFKVGYSTDALSLSARYAYIQAQPLYGFPNDREETSFGGSARFKENWRVFGSGTYDFQSNVLIKNSIGFAYDDECFTYLMSYSQKRTTGDEQLTQTIGFRLSFRTLGDIGGSTADVVDVIGTEE